jgi:hypothetical protein
MALRRATELEPTDVEAWSNLGGLLRRQARGSQPGEFDWKTLREAMEAYHKASNLNRNDTYPRINEARIRLLLSAVDPADRDGALENIEDLQLLARFATRETKNDPWKFFDLADTLLLTNKPDEGLSVLHEAIALVEQAERRASLASVIDPLRDFLSVPALLAKPTATAVRRAIRECEKAIAETDDDSTNSA